ncbi:hypothetical protein [Leptospira interrogans]|uniref:hypothetical protein n=1 Tax=Leptospira interrogans TaxID=173 RepID=UPI0009E2DA35|nr:hypothetical protein [Leptospira interrogans]
MDRGLSPKRAINLPPAFLTPSIQEYHIRNCLTFKKHTNLWIALENSAQRFLWIALENSAQRFLWIALENSTQRFLWIALWSVSFTERFVVIPTDLY